VSWVAILKDAVKLQRQVYLTGEATKDFMMGLFIELDWETTGAEGGSLRRALFLMPADVSMTRFNNQHWVLHTICNIIHVPRFSEVQCV
jgi:hypothetical protein